MRGQKVRSRAQIINRMTVKLPSYSINEGMARAAVAAFCAQMDPKAVEIADIKCALSEAVTNCIVHGYKNTTGMIYITVSLFDDRTVKIDIKDKGCGIENVNQARQPLYTTDAENERSGMGFTVMESFCDKVRVYSKCGKGTTVTLLKKFQEK